MVWVSAPVGSAVMVTVPQVTVLKLKVVSAIMVQFIVSVAVDLVMVAEPNDTLVQLMVEVPRLRVMAPTAAWS